MGPKLKSQRLQKQITHNTIPPEKYFYCYKRTPNSYRTKNILYRIIERNILFLSIENFCATPSRPPPHKIVALIGDYNTSSHQIPSMKEKKQSRRRKRYLTIISQLPSSEVRG